MDRNVQKLYCPFAGAHHVVSCVYVEFPPIQNGGDIVQKDQIMSMRIC